MVAVILVVVAFSWSLKSEIGGLALSLFKIGSVAFGNGSTIIPLIQAEAVEAHPWLTHEPVCGWGCAGADYARPDS